MTNLYPLFFNLEGKPCLVVGGGPVALRKIMGLLDAGAEVKVVTVEAIGRIKSLAERKEIELLQRPFKNEDIDGQILVFCATDSEDVNRDVFEAGEAAGVPVNVADQPDLCRFQVPGRFMEGRLQVAVSTQGGSPALSRKLRQLFGETLSPWAARLVEWMAEFRPILKKRMPDDVKARGEFLTHLVDADFEHLKAWAQQADKASFDAHVNRALEAQEDAG
ncbi:MAG: precorrin-2 dehydrogenase/sirohydrochlorin ferrochelatase family protein [Planctomycetota bacterium]|jgi:siroheme synthase-like protein